MNSKKSYFDLLDIKSSTGLFATLFTCIYLTQLSIGFVLIHYFYKAQLELGLNDIVSSAKDDIKYQDGEWDVTEYYADPDIPGRFRLSVFSSEGFVIDRWRPIPGFLDTSDFKHLISYTKPENIHTPTGQDWRMYSKPIGDKTNIIGVVTVSYFSPTQSETTYIDKKLIQTADAILQKVKTSGEKIITSDVIIKNLPFDISFQIVDKYNTVLIKNDNSSSPGRIPNFIDRSYVQQEIQSSTIKEITDKHFQDKYLVRTQVIVDKLGNPVGVIVAATILTLMYDLLRKYLISQLVIGALLIFVFVIISRYLLTKNKILTKQNNTLSMNDIAKIFFSKKDCAVYVDDNKFVLSYATNQYYMCQALFGSPKKKWEVDELLLKFGLEHQHDKNGWRVVYDTMSAINKKFIDLLGLKMIVIDNKKYQINPKLLDKISYI